LAQIRHDGLNSPEQKRAHPFGCSSRRELAIVHRALEVLNSGWMRQVATGDKSLNKYAQGRGFDSQLFDFGHAELLQVTLNITTGVRPAESRKRFGRACRRRGPQTPLPFLSTTQGPARHAGL